ncbi:MAG: LLM class flavin-dependent oxidoreductase [Candidatus Acidiferrales bacterium]
MKIAFGLLNNLPVKESLDIARRAEDLGYDSIWFAEHNFSRDGVSVCAAAGAVTERIRIGPCVVPIFTRSPLLLATTFATLDELTGGRVVLGLGAGSRLLIKAQGIDYERPLSVLREYVEGCRAVWKGFGRHVSYEGSHVILEDAELDFQPIREEIPIYIGATGPKSCELSGEIADGVLLNAFLGEDYVKRTMKLLQTGAAKAGRHLDHWDVGMMLVTCIGESKQETRNRLRPLIALYLSRLPDIAKQTSIWGSGWEEMSNAVAHGGGDAGAKFVSDELVDEVSINGTESDLHEGLEHYLSAGITMPIITPFAEERRVLEALAPRADRD